MKRIFCHHDSLIMKLETRAGISFSSSVKDYYYKYGFRRIKIVLIYMKQNNLAINNRSVRSIFKSEKHLRHMLMPRVETFELILKNHMLHEITRIINDKSIIAKDGEDRILIKKSEASLKAALNKSLSSAMKNSSFNIENAENSIFDWIHHLMLGNLLMFFNALRPKIKECIIKKAFGVNIDHNKITQELEKVRILRNKIAHAEQIFNTKGMKMNITKTDNVNNYPIVLKNNINNSFLKKIFKNVIPYVDDYLRVINKYK